MQLRTGGARHAIRRVGAVLFAVLVMTPFVAAGTAARAGAAPVALYPNLKTLPALDLRFDRADITPDLTGVFHNVLRFSNITENAGEGPLIVNARDQSHHAERARRPSAS